MRARLRELLDDELPEWLTAARRFYVDDLERHAGARSLYRSLGYVEESVHLGKQLG